MKGPLGHQRRPNLPTLLADVEAVVVRGDLGAVSRLNANQVQDELLKQEFLGDHPDLEEVVFRLEDHPLLRGTLTAFELDADHLPARAAAFEAAFTDTAHWPLLTGGMLATGDYQRQRPGSTGWQFGTGSAANDTVWRYVFTNGSRSALASTRAVLAAFLDGLAASGRAVDEHVSTLVEQWRRAREEDVAYDWRYYLLAYPSMREGASGIYFGVDGRMGYSMCMLRRRQLNSNYRDPVLLQVWRASGIGTWRRTRSSPGTRQHPDGCASSGAGSGCAASRRATHSSGPRTTRSGGGSRASARGTARLSHTATTSCCASRKLIEAGTPWTRWTGSD